MANKKFLMAIPVIALVLGMTLVGCTKSGGIGSSGTFTLTDIPSKYDGKYAAFAGVQLKDTSWVVAGAQILDKNQAKLCRISNGNVSMPTWKCYGSDGNTFTKTEKYSGNDTLIVTVVITDKSGASGAEILKMDDAIGGAMFLSIEFSGGGAAASWKSGMSADLKGLFPGMGQ